MQETMEETMEETMGGGYRRAYRRQQPPHPKGAHGRWAGQERPRSTWKKAPGPSPPRPPLRHHVAAPEGGPESLTMGTGHAPADGAPSVATSTRASHHLRAITGAVCMRGYGRCVLSTPRPETPATDRGNSLLTCGDVEAPTTPGLGGGGLCGPARTGAGGVCPPGRRPGEGCVRQAHQLPLHGLLDQVRGRVRLGMRLPEREGLVGEPPLQPHRRGDDPGVAGGLPNAGHRPRVVRARVSMVDGPVRPLPQKVVFPRGPAGVPAQRHGPGAAPRWSTWAFLIDSQPPQLPGPAATPLSIASAVVPTAPPLRRRGRLRPRTRARTSWPHTGTRTPCHWATGR